LTDYNPGTRYVLSYEIDKKPNNAIVKLKPGERWLQPDIEVYAFGSTDLGVSYGVICEGIKIFHAGDLNLWSWKEVSTNEEIASAYEMYEQELDQIALFMDEFDIAFFPVDPRLRIDCEEGAKMFLEDINVKHFFPMHLWGNFRIGNNFQMSYEGGTIIHAQEKTGQKFILDID
jgi:L-ascorbate metabolism protein UlaG (beta-lactamase superfamily)